MLKFIKQHLIRFGIGFISILILLSAFFTYYNNKVMSEALVLKEQSAFSLREVERLYQSLQIMDVSSRGYALIREPSYLFWSVKNARDRNVDVTHNLDSIFKDQGFVDTNYDLVKKGLNDYTDVYEQMVKHLDAKEDSAFFALLRQDAGRYFWQVFSPFSQNITAFEDKVNDDAEAAYEAASFRNVVVQVLLVLGGIPILIIIAYRLAREERDRRKLLLNVAENNNKYLFNDNKEVKSDARSILDRLIVDLKNAAQFVNEISAQNYDAKWKGLEENNLAKNESTLAGRLMFMRDEMKRVKEEDRKRIWSTEGLSDLSQIIRKYQNEPEKFTFESLTFLVKYMNAQQGGMFVLQHDEEERPYLELSACYAFNRKKYEEKRIDVGEGLIGQAFQEGSTVFLRLLPEGYTTITSGMGDATPRCLIIVPMKYNDEVRVVMEMASFQEFAPHEIEFLERAGEFIASAIASVQNTQHNNRMMEQMRMQTEQMRAQEEELRQNLEELEATQEDMRRKQMT